MIKRALLISPLLITTLISSLTANILHEAIQKSDCAETKNILENQWANVYALDDEGYTPLHRAILLPYNHTSEAIIRLLLKYSADPTQHSRLKEVDQTQHSRPKNNYVVIERTRNSITVGSSKEPLKKELTPPSSPFAILALKEKEGQLNEQKSLLTIFFKYGSFFYEEKEITLENIQKLNRDQLEKVNYRPHNPTNHWKRLDREKFIKNKMMELIKKYNEQLDFLLVADSNYHFLLARSTKNFSEQDLTNLFTNAEKLFKEEKAETLTMQHFERALKKIKDNNERLMS